MNSQGRPKAELLLAQNLVKQPLPLELGLAVSFAAEPWSSKELFSEGQGVLDQIDRIQQNYERKTEATDPIPTLSLGSEDDIPQWNLHRWAQFFPAILKFCPIL